MQRNEVTTLDKLQTGDSFLIAGDKSKKVWNVNQIQKNVLDRITMIYIETPIYNKAGIAINKKTKGYSSPETIQVIFLRSKQTA